MYDRTQVVVTLLRTIGVTATGRREAPGKKITPFLTLLDGLLPF